MPLTLVTGPANAEKAGAVLGAYRAALDRDPLLVVPTAADADHYRRELAGEGIVFGSQVLSASRFAGELVRRSGVGGRPLGALARERVAAAIAGRTRLEALAASAQTPGFARALLRLADELAEHRVGPARFAGAMRAWAAEEAARAPYASELARLHGALRHALDGIGRPDPVLRAFAALDALRTEPWRWGGAPVFLYGFDDLSALQLDAVATLARHVAAVRPQAAKTSRTSGQAGSGSRTTTATSSGASRPSRSSAAMSAATSSSSARGPPPSSSRTALPGATAGGGSGSNSERSRWCSAARDAGA